MGNSMRRLLWPSVLLALAIAYPLVWSTPFQQRLGALVLLYAITASAWNIVGGTYAVLGLRIEASRLLAGVVALVVTLGLHLLLTRTSLGSKMLAVAEDATAAQLMGIRPDTMQAIAWAIAAGATGLAGALIATFFYIVPTVGETLGIVAFITVSLGGFGSVPGALVAGLLIGVIESLSAYLIGAVYKDIVVYALFLSFLWFRPQGLMGKT